jgi:hypothetical protein
MTGRDLAAEMSAAAAQLSSDDRAELIALGIDRFDVCQLCGIAPVRRCGGELYEPDPAGRAAIITPVLVQDPATPESNLPHSYCRFGEVVDLVAWDPRRPRRWALRVGAAEWLGCIEPQYLEPDPVPIRSSVLSWFRAGCRGLVLLSRSAPDQYRLLSVCFRIAAEDRAHQAELRRVLSLPWKAPPVLVAAGGSRSRVDHPAATRAPPHAA